MAVTAARGRTVDSPLDSTKSTVIAVVVLLGSAIALRLAGLGPSSLWLDDAWVAVVHRLDSAFDIFLVGVTAPGFAFLLKALFSAVGFSELAAQMPAFVAGVIGPPAVFLLARRLGIRTVPAILAGALIVVAPSHVDHSVTVKQFTMDLTSVALAMWLAWRVIESPSHKRWSALFAVSVVATILSASVVPAIVAANAAAVWPRLRDDDWRQRAWVLAYGVFLAVWAIVILNNVRASLVTYWSDYTSSGPADVFVALARTTGHLLGAESLAVGGAALVFFVIGGLLAPAELRLLLWGPLVLAAVASFVRVPLGTGRTDLYLYASITTALAWTFDALVRRARLSDRTVLAVGGVLLLVAVFPLRVAGYPEEDARPLIEQLEGLLDEEDVLLTIGSQQALMAYAPWPVSIELSRQPQAIRGWVARHHGVNVIGGLSWWDSEQEFAQAFPELDAERVLVLHTHVPREVLRWGDRQLTLRGYQHETVHTRPGASLTVYTQATG